MNFAILSFIIGFILQFEALFLLLPWIVGMIYGEYHVALIYLVTAAVCFILGKLLSFRHTGRFKELYVREGFWRNCTLYLVKKMSKLCKKPLKSGIK